MMNPLTRTSTRTRTIYSCHVLQDHIVLHASIQKNESTWGPVDSGI